jgi:hypothetical protein
MRPSGDSSDEGVPTTGPIKKRKPRGTGPEAHRVIERLKGFDLEESPAWKAIQKQFTIGITHAELTSVALLVCSFTKLRVDRDAIRDNRVLIKWFDENWAMIEPHIQTLHLRDDGEAIIGMPDYLS